jgi:hypothetical protein
VAAAKTLGLSLPEPDPARGGADPALLYHGVVPRGAVRPWQ